MRLLYNTSDDSALSVAEIIAADEVIDMHTYLDVESDKPVPGIIFTLKAIESLPAKECYYDTIYWFNLDNVSNANIIRKLYQEDKLDLTMYEGITLWNASLQSLREHLESL